MIKTILGLAFLIGCSSSDPVCSNADSRLLALALCSDPPPSCQQALTHYYASGCSYFDITTNPPTPIAQTQEINTCQNIATAVPPQCRDELDAWLICNEHVPDHATTNIDCDCSAEYMALLECR